MQVACKKIEINGEAPDTSVMELPETKAELLDQTRERTMWTRSILSTNSRSFKSHHQTQEQNLDGNSRYYALNS